MQELEGGDKQGAVPMRTAVPRRVPGLEGLEGLEILVDVGYLHQEGMNRSRVSQQPVPKKKNWHALVFCVGLQVQG